MKDGRIVAVGTSVEIAAAYHAPLTLPGEQRVLMPGLVNGHTHAAMVLFRGLADDLALSEWLTNFIFPAEGMLRAKKTDYLSFLFGYHEVILEFVRKVVADVELDDVLREWVKHCAHYSRGFGGPEGSVDKEAIATRIAIVIWNCSVVHSADHWDFFHSIPMEHKPTRLRIPPPFERGACAFDVKDLTTTDDRLRQYMWHELYVKPWTLKRLCEVDYQFVDEELHDATRDFKRQLASYESGLPTNSYIPLREIATSIQY